MFVLMIQKLILRWSYRFFKLCGIRMPPFASASVIIVDDNKVLTIKLSYARGYALPGGLLQDHETFEDAARRELKEETGLEVKIGGLVGTYSSYKDFPTINQTFVAETVSGKILSSKEGSVEWIEVLDLYNKAAYEDTKAAVKDFFRLDKTV